MSDGGYGGCCPTHGCGGTCGCQQKPKEENAEENGDEEGGSN